MFGGDAFVLGDDQFALARSVETGHFHRADAQEPANLTFAEQEGVELEEPRRDLFRRSC